MLRTWLGAKRRLSRKYVFEAAGVPKIRDFSAYLLVKRSFTQNSKNLKTYPIPSIKKSLKIINKTRSRDHIFDKNVRPGTISKTETMDFEVWQREHGSATAWLTTILKEEPRLGTFLKNRPDWVDSYARKRLFAKSIKLKNLMSKSERAIYFESKTPEI